MARSPTYTIKPFLTSLIRMFTYMATINATLLPLSLFRKGGIIILLYERENYGIMAYHIITTSPIYTAPITITIKVVVILLSGGEKCQRIERIHRERIHPERIHREQMKEYVRDKLKVEGRILTPERNGKDIGAIPRLWRDVPHELPLQDTSFVRVGFNPSGRASARSEDKRR